MRASGNGSTDVCASNLLLTFRGEVPYERVKGLDPRLMDKPVTTAEPEIRQDAEWLLETYEPRAEVQRVTLEPISGWLPPPCPRRGRRAGIGITP